LKPSFCAFIGGSDSQEVIAMKGFVIGLALLAWPILAWAGECHVPVRTGKNNLVNGLHVVTVTSCQDGWLEGLQGQQHVWFNLHRLESLAEAPPMPQPPGFGKGGLSLGKPKLSSAVR
jgi:hypothetical protein